MLQVNTSVGTLVDQEQKTIKAILYFSIFHYPLSRKEVELICGDDFSSEVLDDLVQRGMIGKRDSFYGIGIQDNWKEKRLLDEARFEKVKSKLQRSSKIIRRFPFVEGVALSGASSKNLMKEDGDLDFFIITKPGRLWICRTLLIVNKKLLRFNSKRYFCVNYFITSDNLSIPDKNRFTASEIIYLAPLFNTELFQEFFKANSWVNSYYRNSKVRKDFPVITGRPLIKRLSELVLSGSIGSRLDSWSKKRTIQRWEKKFGHYDDHDFELTMRSENDVSKHHPSNFQKRILDRYEKLAEEFQSQYNCTLNEL